MNKQLKRFWHDFCQSHNLECDTPVEAWAFGVTPQQADELADLVNQGIKTATSAYELYGNEKLPEVGEWSIILDSKGEPVCAIQDKLVEIVPYNLISKEHAYHEGEGDQSYEYWRRVHDDFFKWEYQEAGKEFYSQAPMVCEVFEKVE